MLRLRLARDVLSTTRMLSPILKIPGGKRRLARAIVAEVPVGRVLNYHEPFCGGAAVFMELFNSRMLTDALIYLSDANFWLIAAYLYVRDHPRSMHVQLADLRRAYLLDPNATFYSARKAWNAGYRSEALHLFLQQTCFNGLWRENKSGEMNSPWRRSSGVAIPSEDLLVEVSRALAAPKCELRCEDWAEALARVDRKPSSLVYVDPPYFGTFDKYTPDGFDESSHVRLLQTCSDISTKGGTVLYSNADHPQVREWLRAYWPDGEIKSILADRPMNRSQASELLVIGGLR